MTKKGPLCPTRAGPWKEWFFVSLALMYKEKLRTGQFTHGPSDVRQCQSTNEHEAEWSSPGAVYCCTLSSHNERLRVRPFVEMFFISMLLSPFRCLLHTTSQHLCSHYIPFWWEETSFSHFGCFFSEFVYVLSHPLHVPKSWGFGKSPICKSLLFSTLHSVTLISEATNTLTELEWRKEKKI